MLSHIFFPVNRVKTFFPSFNRRLCELFPVSQFFQDSNALILPFVTFQRLVDRIVILYFDYEHIIFTSFIN